MTFSVALWYDDHKNPSISSPWQCGGTLINSRWVLTAAHCLVPSASITTPPDRIRVGDLDLMSPDDDLNSREYDVSAVIIHPLYNRRMSSYNDLGLLKTNTTVEFSYFVYPACLHIRNELAVQDLFITGWGRTERPSQREDKSRPLRWATVRATENNGCTREYSSRVSKELSNSLYPRGMISSLICAITAPGKKSDTCEGDSGGPLQFLSDAVYYVAGVTSFGISCGGVAPGVYTRVSFFAPWIEVFAWSESHPFMMNNNL